MNAEDFVKFALQITAMLGVALLFGQVMRRFKQPAVLGELIGGIILGPTIVGFLFPQAFSWLFQSSDSVTVVREASIKLGMLFFLFTAGLQVNLSDLRRLGRRALTIGLVGTLLPIAAGVGLVYLLPHNLWGPAVQEHFFLFALFIGINLANSANPVIARILMDLGLLKEEIGTIIMTATVVDDMINWTLFALILSVIAPARAAVSMDFSTMLVLIVALFVLTLGLGRLIAPRALAWVRSHVSWPSGFIAFTALVILLAGSLAEFIGIHAFLGAFLVGAAVSGSNKEADEANEVIGQFVMSFFAPIYFVSIGMATNFAHNFDWTLVILLFAAACATKFGSVLLGARLGGMRINNQVLAIASGLNARGATGIILAGIGLANGLIDERIFVAIFIMAVSTSIMSGPLMKAFLSNRMPIRIKTKNEIADIASD